MKDYKEIIAEKLEGKELGLSKDDIYQLIEIPPQENMGDYSFPCFQLAKTLRKNPAQIATELASTLDLEDFAEVKNVGPYINFFLDRKKFENQVINTIIEKKENFGKSDMGKGKTAIVEFSSVNIAKPFHIGHIRSTVIGDALRNIHEFLGYDTIATNYIGDYGTQFGILLAAYEKWGDKETINKDPIKELLNLYVRYNDLVEKEPEKMEAARDWFRRLEAEDEVALETWNWFKEISMKEFNRVYDLLNIQFDSYDGEYYHSKFVGEVVERLKEKDLLEESEEAQIVSLEDEDIPPAIILKRDGSSTYITRDIATAMKRMENYNFEKNIYVVATQQNLHFRQLKAVLKKMGFNWYDKIEHVAFGMVSLKDGTLSTRKGRVVFLEDVLNTSIQKTLDIIEERNPNLENKEEVARKVGIGAIKFQELFNNRIKDYVFDWDELLSFEGETGPYVQYSHARANSLIDRYGKQIDSEVDFKILNTEAEKNLIMALYQVNEVIVTAMEKLEPSIISRHLVEIAKSFNKFYNNTNILKSTEEEQRARMSLVFATKITLKNLLALLGIDAPERM